MGGAFWGLLFGLMKDVGIDDGFINQVREKVTPGSSALFVRTSDEEDRLRKAFSENA